MLKLVICFLSGIGITLLLPNEPSLYWGLAIPVLLVACKYNIVRPVCFLLLGGAWTAVYSYYLFHYQVAPVPLNQPVSIQGDVISIPQKTSERMNFRFKLTKINDMNLSYWQQPLVDISCYQCPELMMQQGQTWSFQARLKRIRSVVNPELPISSDYWLTQKTLLKGSIVHYEQAMQDTSGAPSVLSNWRRMLKVSLTKAIGEHPDAAVVQSLLLGDRAALSSEQWTQFRKTATSHLMAISGLHVGLIAVCFGIIAGGLWRCSVWACHWIAAPKMAVLMGSFAGLLYAVLTGFALPAQRASMMLMLFAVLYCLNRKVLTWHSWSCALLIILVLNPFQVLSPSLWLSFAAVAIIISVHTESRAKWLGFLKLQFMISVGLAPLVAYFFAGLSLIGIAVNLVIIPWMGMVVMPSLLLGVTILLLTQQPLLLQLALYPLSWMMYLIEQAANTSFAFVELPAFNIASLLLGCIVVGLWLFRSTSMRVRFVLSMLCIGLAYGQWYWQRDSQQQQVRLTVLDVGQGLAVIMQVQQQVLVYDLGPSYPNGYSSALRIVSPYLQRQGLLQIERLVISHWDQDHAGGLDEFMAQMPVQSLVAPFSAQRHDYLDCQQVEPWSWQGVQFRFLTLPDINDTLTKNNRSCVLQIKLSNHSVLLTGDIELAQELAYVRAYHHALQSDILLVPHHGSQTSSSYAFLNYTEPRYSVASTGFLNHFNFPNDAVVQKYQFFNSLWYNTAVDGAVEFQFKPEGLAVLRHRQQQLAWYQN